AEDLGDLVGPARVPDPAVDRPVDELAGLRLARALRSRDLGDELVATTLHQLGDAIQHLTAVHRGLVGPRLGRLAGGPHRIPEVLPRGANGVGQRIAVRRPHDVGPAALRTGEVAADVQLVGLADVDPAGLRHQPAPSETAPVFLWSERNRVGRVTNDAADGRNDREIRRLAREASAGRGPWRRTTPIR